MDGPGNFHQIQWKLSEVEPVYGGNLSKVNIIQVPWNIGPYQYKNYLPKADTA